MKGGVSLRVLLIIMQTFLGNDLVKVKQSYLALLLALLYVSAEQQNGLLIIFTSNKAIINFKKLQVAGNGGIHL